MTGGAVLDSTRLIALERIERLEVLTSLFDSIYVPPEVLDEIGGSPVGLLTKEVASLLNALRTQLDAVEAAAIALAAELGNLVVVLDDEKARRVARQRGLSVIGTVGLGSGSQRGVVEKRSAWEGGWRVTLPPHEAGG